MLPGLYGGECKAAGIAPLEVLPLACEVIVESDAGICFQTRGTEIDVYIPGDGGADAPGIRGDCVRSRNRLLTLFPEAEAPITAVQAEYGGGRLGGFDFPVAGLLSPGFDGAGKEQRKGGSRRDESLIHTGQ